MLARTNRLLTMSLGFVALLLAGTLDSAVGLGFHDFGDGRLSPLNYRDWPGIMSVITHHPWVYHQEWNGNEHFCYRSDAKVLNEVLTKYAAVEAIAREVVLLPGIGSMATLGNMSIEYDWHVHIRGFSSAVAAEDKGFFVCPTYPTVWVSVGGSIDLKGLRVPKGIGVLGLTDLRRRYVHAFTSQSKQVIVYAVRHLAKVDYHSRESATAIAGLLHDEDSWVRAAAATAIGRFGRHARFTKPLLQRGLHDPEERVRKACKKAISGIEKAKERTKAARKRAADLEAIERYCKAWEISVGLSGPQ